MHSYHTEHTQFHTDSIKTVADKSEYEAISIQMPSHFFSKGANLYLSLGPHQRDNCPLDTQQGFQTSKTEQKTWAELDHIFTTDKMQQWSLKPVNENASKKTLVHLLTRLYY